MENSLIKKIRNYLNQPENPTGIQRLFMDMDSAENHLNGIKTWHLEQKGYYPNSKTPVEKHNRELYNRINKKPKQPETQPEKVYEMDSEPNDVMFA